MNKLNLDTVKSNMKLPPELQEAYTIVVKNGLKVMTDPSTQEFVLDQMQGDDVAEKLGEGIAYLVGMMFKESNQTIPPQLLIPAGLELLMHAVDVMQKAGDSISDKEVAEAMGVMVESIFEAFGADPKSLQTADSGLKPQGA